jgi:NAD(P)-dependent dehydrogenase (short-subunit alcohol dehydrogenase family)
MKRLQGRVALVTGGLRGIGGATVDRLLDEGAVVIIADLKPASDEVVQATLQRLGQASSYVQLNVTSEADWQSAAETVRRDFGRLDILVGNAGIDGVGSVDTMPYETWKRVMAVNIDGLFLGTKYFAPLMTETGAKTRGGASIINISSIMGMVGWVDASPYNASKGAARLFTKATALEFARKGIPIRVNSVHPGFIRTPLLQEGMDRAAEDPSVGATAQDMLATLDQGTPIGRIGEASEIAAGIAFLASDDASFMTGSELVIDGGWTAQ